MILQVSQTVIGKVQHPTQYKCMHILTKNGALSDKCQSSDKTCTGSCNSNYHMIIYQL